MFHKIHEKLYFFSWPEPLIDFESTEPFDKIDGDDQTNLFKENPFDGFYPKSFRSMIAQMEKRSLCYRVNLEFVNKKSEKKILGSINKSQGIRINSGHL